MYKKKLAKKYIIVIAIIVIALLLAFVFALVKSERNLSPFEGVIKDSGNMISKALYKPFELFKDKEPIAKSSTNINAREKELEAQIEEMKQLLDLNSLTTDYEYLNATVISRNVGYWYNTITIDKGKTSGVKKDMMVMVNGGVIGRINKVSNFTSTVKLLTTNDNMSPLSVKINIGDKYVFGILQGYDNKNHRFIIEGISGNDKIPVGSEVVTTGLSDNSPSGLLIGKVKKVKTDNFDLARNLEVESSANFDNINYVSIVKKKDKK